MTYRKCLLKYHLFTLPEKSFINLFLYLGEVLGSYDFYIIMSYTQYVCSTIIMPRFLYYIPNIVVNGAWYAYHGHDIWVM